MKKHNFSAGPSILPQATIEASAQAVLDWNQSGLSLIEVSHRGENVVAVVNESIQLIKKLLKVPEGYDIIFCHGGASMQFCMIPYNLLKVGGCAAYVDTGTWSSKAIKEAKLFGDVDVVASSKEDNYKHFPTIDLKGKNYDYLHITTNNTIYGTEIFEDIDVNVPLIADMSSDIFSRPVDVSKYDMIYAGAQKNLGPAGVAIAIIKKGLLGNSGREIPSMLNYQTHIDKDSMFNTPPVFAIYASLQTLKWLDNLGGVEVMEERNKAKAALLYDEIDRNSMFVGTVKEKDRSRMNVSFIMHNRELEADFLDFSNQYGISGIKGHRSVGGFRASIYNAMDISSVAVLVQAMKDYEKENA